MAIGDLAELSVIYQGPYSEYVNTFGFKALDSGSTFANLASAFQTALVKNTSGGLLFPISADVSVAELHVRDVVPGTAAGYDLAFSPVLGGDSGSHQLPPQAAVVLSWKTALAGRSYRGRTYMPGLTEGNQEKGDLSGAIITNFTTIITQMINVFGVSGTDPNWRFVIISRWSNGVERNPPTSQDVTSGLVRPYVYNQRRRTIGVGS